jgi:hypothetical protein
MGWGDGMKNGWLSSVVKWSWVVLTTIGALSAGMYWIRGKMGLKDQVIFRRDGENRWGYDNFASVRGVLIVSSQRVVYSEPETEQEKQEIKKLHDESDFYRGIIDHVSFYEFFEAMAEQGEFLKEKTFWMKLGFFRESLHNRQPSRTVNKMEEHRWACFTVPMWALMVGFGVWPAGYVARRILRRRPGLGHCGKCGYDLRATPERCPECGQRVVESKHTTI